MISTVQYKQMCLDTQTECQCDDNNFYTFSENVVMITAENDRSRQGNKF